MKNIFRVIIGLGVIQSTIAICQFLIQHSVGLTWLRESLISPDVLGVAKIILDGHKIIRAYGIFPHPNVLGGFLLVSIILTWVYFRLFHVEQNIDPHSTNCSTWNNGQCEVYKPIASDVPRGTIIQDIPKAWIGQSKTVGIFAIQILALITTFSKSAILALIIAAGYVFYKNVPRGTKLSALIKRLFHVEQFGRKFFLVLGVIVMLLIIAKPDANSLLFKSLKERLFYLNVSRGTIFAHPLIGVGAGQSVREIIDNVPRGTISIESWQHQPVHNVFLLIWSELGVIGVGLFAWWLWKLFHVEQNIDASDIKCSTWNNGQCEVYESIKQKDVPRGTFRIRRQTLRFMRGLLLGLIFIMFFDHYLWDIQQGQALFWLIPGIIVGMGNLRH